MVAYASIIPLPRYICTAGSVLSVRLCAPCNGPGAGVRERDVHGKNGQWRWWSEVLRRFEMIVGIFAVGDFGVEGSL